MNARRIHGAGTSEAEWRGCAALRALPVVRRESIVPGGSRLVVCAPHPDDEVLPCGGLVMAAAEAGIPVVILALTDGEGSHGDDPVVTPEVLRARRPEETAEALRRLEVGAEVRRGGWPDGGLTEREEELRDAFRGDFRAGDVVVTPWGLDGHPDHEATARAARRAAAERGCAVLETPIWGWHWSRPEDTPLPWKTGVRFELSESQGRRKRAAIAAFESQVAATGGSPPILTAATRERFTRGWEVFFR